MRLLRERASNQLCCISSFSYRERQFAVTSSDIAAVHLLSQLKNHHRHHNTHHSRRVALSLLRCVPSLSANQHAQIKIDQLRPLPSIAAFATFAPANARPTPKSAAHLVPACAASWTIANPLSEEDAHSPPPPPPSPTTACDPLSAATLAPLLILLQARHLRA